MIDSTRRAVPRHRWHRRRAALLTALACLALSSAAWPVAKGDAAPSCAAAALDGGAAMSVADYRGEVVYLDFWASWCGPCRESFPFMNELNREFRDKGLRIVAISVDKTPEAARRFLVRNPAQFAIALDTTAACPAAFQLPGMPTSYLIDRNGAVRAVYSGFHPGDRAEIRRQLLELLAGS